MDSNKASEALALIARASGIIQGELSRDTSDASALGCHHALNAISQVLAEVDNGKKDPYHVISNLCGAVSAFADHYKTSLEPAVRELLSTKR